MKSFFCITLAMACLLCSIPASAEKPAVPADGIKMGLTKKPVVFNHSTHTKQTCEECHHPVNGKADYRKCSTAGCHDLLGSKNKKVINSYYRIAHDKKVKQFDSCLSCHVKVAKEFPARKKELTGCKGSGCHP